MPRGRLTLYRPAYCDAVVHFTTIAAFARHVGVSYQTVYRWTYAHPEFAEAVKAMTRCPPTLYQAAYCDAVVEFLKDGYSLAAFGGKIGVTHRAIYDWIDKHPDFAEAVKRGQAQSALWWERRILEFAKTGQGNASAIIFGLKNRASDEWRDKTHTELAGKVEQVHRIERRIVRPEHSDG